MYWCCNYFVYCLMARFLLLSTILFWYSFSLFPYPCTTIYKNHATVLHSIVRSIFEYLWLHQISCNVIDFRKKKYDVISQCLWDCNWVLKQSERRLRTHYTCWIRRRIYPGIIMEQDIFFGLINFVAQMSHIPFQCSHYQSIYGTDRLKESLSQDDMAKWFAP